MSDNHEVCDQCFAYVDNLTGHRNWHSRLDGAEPDLVANEIDEDASRFTEPPQHSDVPR
jgi:hypothetical protein